MQFAWLVLAAVVVAAGAAKPAKTKPATSKKVVSCFIALYSCASYFSHQIILMQKSNC